MKLKIFSVRTDESDWLIYKGDRIKKLKIVLEAKLLDKTVTITENKTSVITSDPEYDGLNRAIVLVVVPVKAEQLKSVTITSNGSTSITPDEGFTLSSVNVTTDVPLKNIQLVKEAEITEIGRTIITPKEGYDGIEKTILETNLPCGQLTTTENGVYYCKYSIIVVLLDYSYESRIVKAITDNFPDFDQELATKFVEQEDLTSYQYIKKYGPESATGLIDYDALQNFKKQVASWIVYVKYFKEYPYDLVTVNVPPPHRLKLVLGHIQLMVHILLLLKKVIIYLKQL